MASIGLLNFYGFILFLYVTSVITLTVNDGTEVNKLLQNNKQRDSTNVVTKNESGSKTAQTITMEGGGSIAFMHSESKDSVVPSMTTPKSKSDKESISKGKETSLVQTELHTSKIVPRKEAKDYTQAEKDETHTEKTDISPVKESSPEKNDLSQQKDYIINKMKPTTATSSKESNKTDIINKHLNQSLSNNTQQNVSIPVLEKNITATTLKPDVTSKKHKPKPTATVGGADIDKPIPASPTKTTPLGMPSKIDYIVPVVITILALPVLGAIAFIMYTRGRDCWDKRHYRRMDFLIDGMYND